MICRVFKDEPTSDWAQQLIIPKRFSGKTTEAMKTGVMTKGARSEIMSALATLIMVYTIRPTPDDMYTVCRRLVQTYPKLKDSTDTGDVSRDSSTILYNIMLNLHLSLTLALSLTHTHSYMHTQGSWKEMMRTKFRNLRRPSRAEKAGIAVPPPPKKFKKASVDSITAVQAPSESDIAEYTRHIEFIRRSYQSKRWSQKSMITLLQQTAKQRRSWIKNECPSVKDVLKDFPCLADPKLVKNQG